MMWVLSGPCTPCHRGRNAPDMLTSPQDMVSPSLLASLRTFGALAVLAFPLIYALPFLSPLRNLVNNLFPDQAPLSSLVPPRPPSREEIVKAKRAKSKLWLQIVLVGFGLAEAAVWMGITGSEIVTAPRGEKSRDILLAVGMVFVWVSLIHRPVVHADHLLRWYSP